jgi:hypothetical protein
LLVQQLILKGKSVYLLFNWNDSLSVDLIIA